MRYPWLLAVAFNTGSSVVQLISQPNLFCCSRQTRWLLSDGSGTGGIFHLMKSAMFSFIINICVHLGDASFRCARFRIMCSWMEIVHVSLYQSVLFVIFPCQLCEMITLKRKRDPVCRFLLVGHVVQV
jgi:hypothetical protein